MNERIITIPIPAVFPGASAALGDAFAAVTTPPFPITIIYVSAAPSADDADLTLDINDDGTAAIAAISCAVKATPGTWKSVHVGGTNAPVAVAANSVLTFDANSAANATVIVGYILALAGE